ncbi:MAG: DUF3558 family protein [Acidimicrobiales bacterium]
MPRAMLAEFAQIVMSPEASAQRGAGLVDREEEGAVEAAGGTVAVALAGAWGRGRHRERVPVLAVGLVAAACVLAACGGGSGASNLRRPGGVSGKSGSTTTVPGSLGKAGSGSGGSASGAPRACTLVSAAQVSAALGVSVNRTREEPDGSGTSCSWSFTATSLVKGLGTNATLSVKRSAVGLTRAAFYRTLENEPELKFAPVTIDGIPAVHGFGSSQPEVLVDVGPVTMTIAALSTISAADDGPAVLAIADDAVSSVCRMVSCSH